MYQNDDSDVTTTALSDADLAAMTEDLAEGVRCEAEITDADLIAMELESRISIREKPEYRKVTSLATDALGQIDPTEADDFLAFIAEWFGTAEWWRVDHLGRIFLTRTICDGEASICGCHIVRFLHGRGVPLTTTVELVPTGEVGMYKPVVVTADGRKPMGYVVNCGRVETARALATEMTWQYNATVVPAGYVAVAERGIIGTEGRAA